MAEPRLQFQDEWLSAAVDGELTAEEQVVFDAALASDAALQREYAVLLALKACVRRAAPAEELPATFASRLAAGLDAVDAAVPASPGFRRWWQPALVLAGALAVVSLLPQLRPATSAGEGPLLDLNAATLAQAHRDWQAHYASLPASDESPEAMASGLSTQVGFTVAAPAPAQLHARLRGCSTCGHSVPGATAAVFVMTRDDSAPMSLFEVADTGCRLGTPGFADSRQPGVRIATVDGVSLACWQAAGVHAVLAAERADAEELAKLAPRAVRLAYGLPRGLPVRYALLP